MDYQQQNNHHLPFGPALPDSLMVICLAEAQAPAQSLIWTLTEHAVRETGQRLEAQGSPLDPPEILKVRSLTTNLRKLIGTLERAVIITGLKADKDAPLVLHRSHRPAGLIVKPPGPSFGAEENISPEIDDNPLPFSQPMPRPWMENEAIPQINTLHMDGELTTMPVWLSDDLPPGGFDFIGIPLPEANSSDWLKPQLGSRFPDLTERIGNILWSIIQGGDEKSTPGSIESTG